MTQRCKSFSQTYHSQQLLLFGKGGGGKSPLGEEKDQASVKISDRARDKFWQTQCSGRPENMFSHAHAKL